MDKKVFYYSKTGNTKKIAETIAQVLGSKAESTDSGKVNLEADILFLGASIYKKDIHASVKKTISELQYDKIKLVVLFSTGFSENAILIMKEFLQKKGIKVSDKYFVSRGKFLFFNRKHPNKDDIKNAEEFGKLFL